MLSRRSRSLLLACALVAALLHPGGVDASGPALPSTGAWFGAWVTQSDRTGPTPRAAIANFEEMTGRRAALLRRFYGWNAAFPASDDYWARDGGRTLILSWGPRRYDGSLARWADIANGSYDAVIDRRAAAVKAFGAPLFFIFSHEPELLARVQGGAGASAAFVQAWRHVHDRFQAAGVRNVSWLLTLTAQTYAAGTADNWYPGDGYVDVLGADGYNFFTCTGGAWRSFRTIFGAFRTYGVTRGKPMLIPEWGSVEDPAQPGRKAAWIGDAAATLRTWPEIKGIAWFHSAPDCPWWVDSSLSSLDAYATMAADPHFNAPLPAFVPTRPTVAISSGPATLTAATSARFTFAASSSPARYLCQLDGAPAQPCVSGVTYTALAAGAHDLFVSAVDSAGNRGSASAWTWNVFPARASVTAADFAFSAGTVSTGRGTAVRWSFSGPSDHTATSWLDLFDSGVRRAGSSFAFPLVAAGTYGYRCRLHPEMTGTLKVPLGVTPTSGGTRDVFRLLLGAVTAPPGYIFDVQIRRPGATQWSDYATTTRASDSFAPDAGPGKYSFRARLRSLRTGKASAYSPAGSLTAS